MEFYYGEIEKYAAFDGFQFPTGWNSTYDIRFSAIRHSEFQFPTGWNSTLKFAQHSLGAGFQFPTGWNSTPGKNGKHKYQEAVSIPNGMEFYNTLTPRTSKKECFNSQRDGILLYIQD